MQNVKMISVSECVYVWACIYVSVCACICVYLCICVPIIKFGSLANIPNEPKVQNVKILKNSGFYEFNPQLHNFFLVHIPSIGT